MLHESRRGQNERRKVARLFFAVSYSCLLLFPPPIAPSFCGITSTTVSSSHLSVSPSTMISTTTQPTLRSLFVCLSVYPLFNICCAVLSLLLPCACCSPLFSLSLAGLRLAVCHRRAFAGLKGEDKEQEQKRRQRNGEEEK